MREEEGFARRMVADDEERHSVETDNEGRPVDLSDDDETPPDDDAA